MSVRTRRAGPAAAVLLVVTTLLAGCVRMPSDGPVEEPQAVADVDEAPGIFFDPRPPRAGEPPADVVEGFLEAMKATPVRATVARQFLSREAAEAWVPEEGIITYGELGTPRGQTSVRVPLKDVNVYDERGAWQRTQRDGQLDLELVEEAGEWRIGEVPDALIVPGPWFDDWYQRVSLYYFDPASEVLVPEPVFVPRGDQFASSLVRGLLIPPDDGAQDVTRTYFPPGTSHGLSVPISTAGIAEVSLSGNPDAVDDETAERMLAQLAWTLRQEPSINAVRLTVGGRPFGGPSGSDLVSFRDVDSDYDPGGTDASTDLFALAEGRVVTGAVGAFNDTSGPLGADATDARHIGVNLDGSRLAAVSGDGSGLLVAPTEVPDGEITPAVDGAVDLAPPGWDHRDRIWVLDRGAGRARVVLVVDGTARVVDVPGVSGRAVTRLLVSRDGSRLVAVVRGRRADSVVSARIRHDADGTVLGASLRRTLPLPAEGSRRIRDIGWRSPTTVSVLSDINDSSQVRTISVDGAPGEIAIGGTTRLRGPTRRLVSSPVDLADTYALAGRAVYSLTRPERAIPDLPPGLRSLTYVG